MKERPIIFSEEMIKAILDGRKTQTRRVINPPPRKIDYIGEWGYWKSNHSVYAVDTWMGEKGMRRHLPKYCPFGKRGDILWVREKHNIECPYPTEEKCGHPEHVYYWASEEKLVRESFTTPWRPSIFMPRWSSRITLEIIGVRVERVQEISGRDVLAEGIDNGKSNPKMGVRWENMQGMAFAEVWDSINAKRGYPWSKNPWVWVIEFNRKGE